MFKKINNKGFTIVETLIVLAIAATIIVVVLLAVPALQRQSRNTNVKNGAGTIASGWAAEVGNANGSIPTAKGGTGTITINGAAYNVNAAITTLSPTNVANTNKQTTVKYSTSNSVNGNTTKDTLTNNSIALYPGLVCPSPTTGASLSLAIGTATQAAIVYSIEPANLGCLQS